MNKSWVAILLMFVVASLLIDDSDAWRRRRRRRRNGKMDESGIEMPEHHSQGLSADAERKFFADFFDEELEDEQNEYDVNNPGSSGITPSRKKKNTN